MRDLSGVYPPVVTRRMMGGWRLTKDHLRAATRDNLLRLGRSLGFQSPERWTERQLLRRVYRCVRSDRKQVVKERHLASARREDLVRLAWFVGLRPRASWSHEKLARRTWRRVDAQRAAL